MAADHRCFARRPIALFALAISWGAAYRAACCDDSGSCDFPSSMVQSHGTAADEQTSRIHICTRSATTSFLRHGHCRACQCELGWILQVAATRQSASCISPSLPRPMRATSPRIELQGGGKKAEAATPLTSQKDTDVEEVSTHRMYSHLSDADLKEQIQATDALVKQISSLGLPAADAKERCKPCATKHGPGSLLANSSASAKLPSSVQCKLARKRTLLSMMLRNSWPKQRRSS